MKKRLARSARRSAFAATAAVVLAWPAAHAQVGEFDQIRQGRYLVAVGDCAACHTAEHGKKLAGGRPLETPFGIIYSPNITPDTETGIGSWTDDQFYHAMHDGISADGSDLFPAFPYPWFTKATRQDIDAIRAYLRTLPAVKYRPPENTFPWPISDRETMAAWNALYFKAGTFQPDKSKSPAWNRGAYLVQGLAHCGACHTPLNTFGAAENSHRLQGGELDHWLAPNLTADKRSGLGGWSTKEIVAFLETGHNDRTIAYGSMADVVRDSTSKMHHTDLAAIATYLKSLPSPGSNRTPSRPSKGVADAGRAIYADQCSACHQSNGQGVPGLFPALKGDAVLQAQNPTSVVRLILNGGHAPSTAGAPTAVSMPSFGWKLSDKEIAEVSSYVRNAWGNEGASVSEGEVSKLRKRIQDVSNAN